MFRYIFLSLVFAWIGCKHVDSLESARTTTNATSRQAKRLTMFEIIRFANDPCIGQGSKEGTCYTSDECTTRGGINSGTCAQGYGICCTFTATCGVVSSENGTYFESNGMEFGECRVKICPCNDGICQLRLDFEQFSISGPSTSTTVSGIQLAGVLGLDGATSETTSASQCTIDSFSALSPSGITPPTICGINSGTHMYVASSAICNDLVFVLGSSLEGGRIENRRWTIKVTQYSCNHPNIPPNGCTQYYFGATVGTVKTYNFDGGQHLANQNQNICIRRERGNCRICYTTEEESDFMTSGDDTKRALGDTEECCNYGSDGDESNYDCVIIPGAFYPSDSSSNVPGDYDRFCGRSAGLVGTDSDTNEGNSQTICTIRQPFNIRFLSDGFEGKDEIDLGAMAGFKLTYIQSSRGCRPEPQ
ncbi:uncharacterized protein LOC131892271 isoform X2 [Tigriopus californicus]|uniref:uncharacterized protein LOC131892271 isoform X2 n=1 Tax=Tigriopus californicus TaxID=6832 RepID=UPI0027D9EC93|nr:uncharacterized protein LOC131892271 isoform X2 [Tigriopus californicus]